MRIVISDGKHAPLVLRTLKDKNRFGWWLTGLKGWEGTPTIRESVIDHPLQDGGMFPDVITQSSRILTIDGLVSSESNIDAGQAMDQINALFGKRLEISVEDFRGTRTATGYLSDQTDFIAHEYGRLLEFTLIITCPDPHKYSNEVIYYASNNILKVSNSGNVDTWGRIHVDGAISSLNLEFNGHIVAWSGSSHGLDIDMRTGECSSGTLLVDDAFSIPPGDHTVAVEATSGAKVYMAISSAWR